MKRFLFFAVFIFLAYLGKSQKTIAIEKIDSIYFHLYTDSLKKGTYNYINVDGKMADGKWKPLTSKEINFTSSYGTFDGNQLILPADPTVQKITIKAVLKSDPALWREVTLWIKKKPDDERLPTNEEIMNGTKAPKKKSKNKSG